MLLNTKQTLVAEDGTPVMGQDEKTPLEMGLAISFTLNRTPSEDPLRAYKLAIDLATKDAVELSEADLVIIQAALKTQKFYYPIVAGQIIDILEKSGKTEK